MLVPAIWTCTAVSIRSSCGQISELPQNGETVIVWRAGVAVPVTVDKHRRKVIKIYQLIIFVYYLCSQLEAILWHWTTVPDCPARAGCRCSRRR